MCMSTKDLGGETARRLSLPVIFTLTTSHQPGRLFRSLKKLHPSTTYTFHRLIEYTKASWTEFFNRSENFRTPHFSKGTHVCQRSMCLPTAGQICKAGKLNLTNRRTFVQCTPVFPNEKKSFRHGNKISYNIRKSKASFPVYSTSLRKIVRKLKSREQQQTFL